MPRSLVPALALAALLAGCAVAGTDAPPAPRGCGEVETEPVCGPEMAVLGEAVAALDEVESVVEVRYITKRTLTRPPAVGVWFVPSDDLEAAKQAIAVLVEESGVAPVRQISFAWPTGDGHDETETFSRAEDDTGSFGRRTYPRSDE